MEVDAKRKRISLTMRLDDDITASTSSVEKSKVRQDNAPKSKQRPAKSKPQSSNNAVMGNAFAEAFAKAKK
jgi:uncharacterized protein